MSHVFTLEQLAARVNDWCAAHDISPVSNQAGDAVTERNIRYYRALGLVDAPAGGTAGYGGRHFLQLVAIRILQAQGLPLRRVRELLYGRSDADLREVQSRGLAEQKAARAARTAAPVSAELWRVTPLDDDFVLISRRGTHVAAAQVETIRRTLRRVSGANSKAR